MSFNNVNDVTELLYVLQYVLCKFLTGEVNVIPWKLLNVLREVHLNDHNPLYLI